MNNMTAKVLSTANYVSQLKPINTLITSIAHHIAPKANAAACGYLCATSCKVESCTFCPPYCWTKYYYYSATPYDCQVLHTYCDLQKVCYDHSGC